MIVHIHKSNPTMGRVLRYNEDKVARGVASVLYVTNMNGKQINNINAAFEIRERMTIRDIEHLSFQMSINPGPDDSITEERIPEFAAELMKELGYEKQPWVIFRHDDIERVHYHVVSIRADERGRKIKDFYEHRKCERITRSLENKYGIKVGNDKIKAEENALGSVIFTPGKENITSGIESCIRDSLAYHFTTEMQFAEILKCHSVQVQEGIGRGTMKGHLSFQGLDSDGRPCTGSVSDAILGFDVMNILQERIWENKSVPQDAARIQLRRDMAGIIGDSCSWKEISDKFRDKYVDIVLYRDSEGRPRAVTFIDHRSRCAFKSSEVSRSLSARLLAVAADENGHGDDIAQNDGIGTDAKEYGVTETLKACINFFIPASISGGNVPQDYMEPRKKKRKR